jgi:GNAT superfamily N-acetyltransferase
VAVERDKALRVEPLASSHDRSRFDSGVEPLDRYFQTQASQDAAEERGRVLRSAAAGPDDRRLHTLSSTSVQLAELPAQTVRKLPRYPLVPATLLGRLAVDRRQQGKGYGRFLLADALYRAARSEIASFAVIVDAKDDSARRFYGRESFLPLPDQPMKLFRPMADIRRLLDEP